MLLEQVGVNNNQDKKWKPTKAAADSDITIENEMIDLYTTIYGVHNFILWRFLKVYHRIFPLGPLRREKGCWTFISVLFKVGFGLFFFELIFFSKSSLYSKNFMKDF